MTPIFTKRMWLWLSLCTCYSLLTQSVTHSRLPVKKFHALDLRQQWVDYPTGLLRLPWHDLRWPCNMLQCQCKLLILVYIEVHISSVMLEIYYRRHELYNMYLNSYFLTYLIPWLYLSMWMGLREIKSNQTLSIWFF